MQEGSESSALGPPSARTLVIPMYEESSRIDRTFDTLAKWVADRSDIEILAVDDGSEDDDRGRRRSRRSPLGTSGPSPAAPDQCRQGGSCAGRYVGCRGDSVVFVDADLSVDTDDIERCFRAIEAGADVAFGSRMHRDSVIEVRQPDHRQGMGKTFNALLKALGLTRYGDTQCGLKGFRRDAAQRLFRDLRTQGFAFDVEILYRAVATGYQVEELPVHWQHVEASRVRPIRDGLSMLLAALRLAVALRRPTHESAPAMSADTFAVMAKIEREHWWFRAKRALTMQMILPRLPRRPGINAVDIGCGTGGMIDDLSGLSFESVLGTDFDTEALSHTVQAGRAAVQADGRHYRSALEPWPASPAWTSSNTSMTTSQRWRNSGASEPMTQSWS